MSRSGLLRFPLSLPLVLALSILCCIPAESQDDTEQIDKRIFQEVRDHNQLMENLQYLSDVIGPRLTGSDQLQKAVTWASDVARRYELDVHVEPWEIAHSWQRGPAHARIVRPIARDLMIASAGWSPGTDGSVRGNIVYVSAKNTEELRGYRGKLRGTLVILQPPKDSSWQVSPSPESPSSVQTPGPVPDHSKPDPDDEFNRARMIFLKEQGVSAVLRDSDKLYGLLNMTNAGNDYQPPPLTVAMLTHEDYALIWRLLQKGSVEIETAISNSFSPGPVKVFNTIAEIRGSEKPDEVVIICAHLDSWDLGTGATDDGTGVVAVLEAARAIKALGLRPKRTIRVVLFTGEEQGEVGSRAYVEQHQAELAQISAVLADDTGTGRLSTIRLNQNFAAHKLVDKVLAPMHELNLIEPGMDRYFGSDYASFNEVGVPGFACTGTQADYFRTHHSQADTFDKVQKEGIVQAAQLLAGWAYNTAQLPTLIPRD